jgi:hypothetical protein
MPLPPPKRLRAGRHMQVELCEIPLTGAPEILRSEAYSDVRRNKPAPCLIRGRMREIPRNAGQMGVFQQPVKKRL